MRAKTTRAFRTISEAGDELGLQPHVLRFWESKFSDITPIKRGGGRRFYRPEDIEFLRGIKTLLHDEKHPIRDVQKLIAKSGAARIVELGRSVEQASRDRDLSTTNLVPERIANTEPVDAGSKPERVTKASAKAQKDKTQSVMAAKTLEEEPKVEVSRTQSTAPQSSDPAGLTDALARLKALRGDWEKFSEKPD